MVAVESRLVELIIIFVFEICCSKIVYSWWQPAATDGVSEQNTSHVTFFLCLRALVTICHTTLAQVFVRVISSMCHAPECLIFLRPSLRTLHLSLPSSTSSSWSFTSSFPCGCCRSKIPCALRQMRSLALWPITSLSQVGARYCCAYCRAAKWARNWHWHDHHSIWRQKGETGMV